MSRDCLNRVGLCDPREPLPPLLRQCLVAFDPERDGNMPAQDLDKLVAADGTGAGSQCWRDAVWFAESTRRDFSVRDTYVQFLTAHGPPGGIDSVARVFGRGLRLLYINDMMGVCGCVVSRPDGTVNTRNFALWEAPDWFLAEMGMPDHVWSHKWRMHVPAKGTAFPLWSQSQGWISPPGSGAGDSEK